MANANFNLSFPYQRALKSTATSAPLPTAIARNSLRGSQTAPVQNLSSETDQMPVATATAPQLGGVNTSCGDEPSLSPPTNTDVLPSSSPSSYHSAHNSMGTGDASPPPSLPSNQELPSSRSPTRLQPLRAKSPASSKRNMMPYGWPGSSPSELSSTPSTPQAHGPLESLSTVTEPLQSGTQTATSLPSSSHSKSPLHTKESSFQPQTHSTSSNSSPLPPSHTPSSHTHPDKVSLLQVF